MESAQLRRDWRTVSDLVVASSILLDAMQAKFSLSFSFFSSIKLRCVKLLRMQWLEQVDIVVYLQRFMKKCWFRFRPFQSSNRLLTNVQKSTRNTMPPVWELRPTGRRQLICLQSWMLLCRPRRGTDWACLIQKNSALLLASEFWTKNLHRMVQSPFTAPMLLRRLDLLINCWLRISPRPLCCGELTETGWPAICLQICRSIPQITAASSAARTLK